MSSDDGWIIRLHPGGAYVLQHYWASQGPPPINEAKLRFATLDEAVRQYAAHDSFENCSEYGLTVQINPIQREKQMLKTTKYARKSFPVDAVQVDEENFEDVATWCQGEVRTETGPAHEIRYVHVRVHRPLNERQTKAYVGDWVLYAGTGYKVYTDKAFRNSFEKVDQSQPQGDQNEAQVA